MIVSKPGWTSKYGWVTSDFWFESICGKTVTFIHTYTGSGVYPVNIGVYTRYKASGNPLNSIGNSSFTVDVK